MIGMPDPRGTRLVGHVASPTPGHGGKGLPCAEGGRDRRLDIQGLRAVAVLMVVAYHAGLPVPGGFTGVDVFFVISGFVITAMLQREWMRSGSIRFGRFYLRRFRRLTPALALMVTVTMVVSTPLLSPLGTQQVAAKTGMGAMLLAANLVIATSTGGYFDAPAETNPLLNTWSLSVEEQFYLVFPLLLAIGWRLARRTRSLGWGPLVLVSAVAAVSFSGAVLGSLGFTLPVGTWLIGFYSPVTRAWEFAVGAVLALGWTAIRAVMPARGALYLGLAGTALLACSLVLVSGSTPFPGVWTLLPVAGTLLLIIAGINSSNRISRVLATRPMVMIGDWSYSIYLWHWPFIVFARLLWPGDSMALGLAAVLSFVPAYASYRWVEEPLRGLEISSKASLSRMVAATVLPPLAISAALGYAARHGFWSPAVAAYQTALDTFHAGQRAGCMASAWQNPGACTWNAAAPGAQIYLVGDSNADQFSEGVIGAGQALGRPVVGLAEAGCLFMDLYTWSTVIDPAENRRCNTYRQGTLKYLSSASPGLVIISNNDEWWSAPHYFVGATPETATVDEGERLRVLRAQLTSTVHALKLAGHQVLIVHTVPMWRDEDSWDPAMWSLVTMLTNPQAGLFEMPVDRALARQGEVRQVIDSVAAGTGASLFDPWPAMCSQGVCSTKGEGFMRYRDRGHISVQQSERFAPYFKDAVAAAG